MIKNKQLFILSALIYFIQGFEQIPNLSLFLFLKEKLHYTPSQIMYVSSIIGIAWLTKPLWGYLADNHLTKKLWIILSLTGSIAVSLFFGLIAGLTIQLVIIVALYGNWNSAMRDVAVDGMMVCEGKKENNCDRLQSVQWISVTFASILASLFGGYIAEHYDYKVAFLTLIPIYLIILSFALLQKNQKNKLHELSFIDTIRSYKVLFLDKRFLFVCLFLFLYKFSPSFGAPLQYIQRDTFKWSAQWMGVFGAIMSGFEIAGALLFYKFCKKINIKKWLYISVFIGTVSTLCYLFYNPITAFIYGGLFAIVGMMIHLIIMSLMAESTLKGFEATSFALLCSVSNLAATANSITGAYLLPQVGLSALIIISAGASFVCLPLIKHLKIKEA